MKPDDIEKKLKKEKKKVRILEKMMEERCLDLFKTEQLLRERVVKQKQILSKALEGERKRIADLENVGAASLNIMEDLEMRRKEVVKAQAASLNIMEDLEMRRKEIEEREKKLREVQQALVQSEKLSAIGQLGAGVAHELNSPLAGLLSLIRSFIKESKKEDPNYPFFLEMKLAAEHAAKIVADLTTFSRKSEEELVPIDCHEVIDKTLNFSAHLLQKEGVKIITKYSKGLPSILGNAPELQQVVLNMITNARDAIVSSKKADEKGGRKKEFSIETKKGKNNKSVEIIFSDTGCGMPQDVAAKIFDPFYTTKPIGKGVGLGLSVSYGIIQNHHGKMEVQTKEGQGTQFKVVLPVAKEKALQSRRKGLKSEGKRL